MNGGYGGAAFDFVDNFGYGGGNNDVQDQQQQQQRYLQNAPQFDVYDPSLNSMQQLFQYNATYNSTGTTHHTFLPPHDSGTSTALRMNQSHMMHQQQQFTNSDPGYMTASSPSAFLPPLDQVQSFHSADKMLSSAGLMSFPGAGGLFPDHNNSLAKQADTARKENPDLWLEQMKVKCSDVSLDPLSGTEILTRVRAKTDDVVTRYLPCVDFLVRCQQDLRAGLAAATQKRMVRHAYRDSMTPKEFYKRYLAPLPDRFYRLNVNLMEASVLNDSVMELNKLCQDSKQVEYQGCEVMKNSFLGGMKDGESWGLRKWLSMHGGALHICNDLECILRSCQSLDRSQDATRKLSERLRPLAKQALDRLKNDVPPSYQEISTAHPYLPFFHRLESALKAMASFDPDDDDVICIDDDDEIEEVKQQAKVAKRAPDTFQGQGPKRKKQRLVMDDIFAEFNSVSRIVTVDKEEVIEIVDKVQAQEAESANRTTIDGLSTVANQDWRCPGCSMLNAPETKRCCMCDPSIVGRDCDSDDDLDNAFQAICDFPFDENNPAWDSVGAKAPSRDSVSPLLAELGDRIDTPTNVDMSMDVSQMITGLETIARAGDLNQLRSLRPNDVAFEESFWNVGPQYASALRLLVSTLRNRDAHMFYDPVDEAQLLMLGLPSFSSMIKHPLCLRDIVFALIGSSSRENSVGSGKLPLKSLSCWNMWRGMDLLQALDLVLLNNLAYNGKEKTKERSATNRLRRVLWDGINGIITVHVGDDIEKRRQYTPTRRGENSGFVVRK